MEINWFTVTYFHNYKIDFLENIIPQTFEDLFTARNIRSKGGSHEPRENSSHTNKLVKFT